MAFKLVPIAGTPDFEAKTRERVTLVTKSHIGGVLISRAQYSGDQLVPSGQAVSTITLTVADDRNSLKMVFVFEASTSGRGELREQDGTDSQFIRALDGSEPFQMIRIVGVK